MKKIFFVLCLLSSINMFAQIPNPSFENWSTIARSRPIGWISNSVNPDIDSTKLVIKTTDAHAGSSAALLRNYDENGVFFTPHDLRIDLVNGPYIELNGARPAELRLWVKFHRGDISIADSVGIDCSLLGTSGFIVQEQHNYAPAQDVYTQITMPLNYITSESSTIGSITLDTRYQTGVVVSSSADSTYAIFDDISFFGGTTSSENLMNNPNAPKLISFNEINKYAIEHTLNKQGEISIQIFDMNGKEVLKPIQQSLPAGTYRSQIDLNELAPNMYCIVLIDNNKNKQVFKVVTQ